MKERKTSTIGGTRLEWTIVRGHIVSEKKGCDPHQFQYQFQYLDGRERFFVTIQTCWMVMIDPSLPSISDAH